MVTRTERSVRVMFCVKIDRTERVTEFGFEDVGMGEVVVGSQLE